MEWEVYCRLIELYVQDELSFVVFWQVLYWIDGELYDEFDCLDKFFVVICYVNELVIFYVEILFEFRDVFDYIYCEVNGVVLFLVDEFEFLVFSIIKGCFIGDEWWQIELYVVDFYFFLILILWICDLVGVLFIVYGYYEKLDGLGYLMGLCGNQISVQICILIICDIYDVFIVGDCFYKKVLFSLQVFDLMSSECQMGWFDSGLFKVFVDVGVWILV